MSRTWNRATIPAVLAVLLAAWPAAAVPQGQVRETRTASPDMRLEVDEIVVGSVRITGWERNEMEVVGHLGRDVTSLQIEGGPDRFEISADWEDWDESDWDDDRRRTRNRDRDQDVDVELEIRVPHGASLEVETVTAPIRVSGVHGRIDLETVTGTIEYGGDSTYLSLATVTGSIEASANGLERGQFETVQGNITWSGALARQAQLSFETVGGNIELQLPADVSASFDVETMMGEIDTDFGVQAQRVSRWINTQELHFTAGDGSARVSIETLQGTVRLRRQ